MAERSITSPLHPKYQKWGKRYMLSVVRKVLKIPLPQEKFPRYEKAMNSRLVFLSIMEAVEELLLIPEAK